MAKEIIAITGATGFVGRHLVPRLQQDSYEVRTLVRTNKDQIKGCQNIVGDLETGQGLEEFMDGAAIIINLVGKMLSPFKDLVSLNATVLDSLCQQATKVGIKKLIHISAAAVYGEPKDERSFTEGDQPLPDTPYSLSKLMGEEVLSFYQRNFDMSIIVLRPPNVYGPGSDHGVVYSLIKSAKETGEITLHGDGTQQRDFLYVADLVDAVIKCLAYKSSDVFNISTSNPQDLNKLAETLKKIMQNQLKVVYQREAQGAKYISASFKKAQRLLNWEPTTNFEQGLKYTLDSF